MAMQTEAYGLSWEVYLYMWNTTPSLYSVDLTEVIHSPQHLPALSVSRRSLSARYAQALRASGGPCGNGRMSTVRRAVSRCLGLEECGVDWVGSGATLAVYRQWYGAWVQRVAEGRESWADWRAKSH